MLPKTLKVGAHTVIVKTEDDLCDGMGSVWSNKLVLRIDATYPPTKQEETLVHEILHIAHDFAGIDKDETLSPETWVTRTSPALYMILKDNGFLQFGEGE